MFGVISRYFFTPICYFVGVISRYLKLCFTLASLLGEILLAETPVISAAAVAGDETVCNVGIKRHVPVPRLPTAV